MVIKVIVEAKYLTLGIPIRGDRAALVVAIILSVVFTISLFYLTFELPYIMDRILHSYFPDLFWEHELREHMLSMMRPIGYLALTITLVLIIIGFITRRSYLTILGSLALYIPVFGYFAFAMFFLAGIGILRVLWLPLIEYSPELLKLGNIALMPYIVSRYHLSQDIIYPLFTLIAMMFIFIGLFIFSIGVATWLYGKFIGLKIINFWIYKYIRHPQYLGYIIWSYGPLIFTYFKPYVRGAFTIPPSYPWLISTLLIIGVALCEEVEMRKKYGGEYENYIRNSAFMIPLPRKLVKAIKWPLKSKDYKINSLRDVTSIIIIYLVILTILSYILNFILGI